MAQCFKEAFDEISRSLKIKTGIITAIGNPRNHISIFNANVDQLKMGAVLHHPAHQRFYLNKIVVPFCSVFLPVSLLVYCSIHT